MLSKAYILRPVAGHEDQRPVTIVDLRGDRPALPEAITTTHIDHGHNTLMLAYMGVAFLSEGGVSSAQCRTPSH